MNSSAPGQLAGVNQFLVRGAGIAPAQIFLDGAGEQRVLLQNHSHVVPEDLQIVILYIYAADPDASLSRIVQPGISCTSVLLEEPIAPSMPTVEPLGMCRSTSCSAGRLAFCE